MARKPTTATIIAKSHPDYMVAKLEDLEKFLATGDARRNAAAFVAGTRLAANLHAEIEALKTAPTETANTLAGLSDDEIVSKLAEALQALPLIQLDDVLERIGAERSARAQPPPLRVVEK